jgi:hypothetical protein
MTEDIEFNAEIIPIDDFQVGDATKNQFKLSIAYRGKETVKLEDCTFYLRIEVGNEQEAMVLNQEAAEKIEAVRSGDHDIEINSYLDKKQYVWKVDSYDESPIKPDDPIQITFSNIISQTKPGTVKLTFDAQIGDKETRTQLIGELVKQSDQAGIIYFYSTTEERQNDPTSSESIAPAAEQIFPGEKVILKWYVHNLGSETLKLTENGRTLLSGDDFKNDKGEKVFEDIRQATEFVLSGKVASESKPRTSKIRVDVLSTGWNDLTKTLDNIKLEPSLLFNANNQTIYAVFRRELPGNKEEGLLFQTGNPFWGWASIKSSVPEDFVTSPGVYCDDKLWFIGGSQIDPDNTSNKVWCFDPHKSKWAELDAAPWVRRMGHACLYIPADKKKDKKEKIWMMGGCDQNGNTLDDVWSFDVSSKTWNPTEIKLPSKRCMFSSVIFNNEIWLCGGVEDDPLSDKLSRDIFVWTGDEWQKKSEGLSFIEGEPTAACLQVFQGKLHVIGKTRKKGAIETFNYLLKTSTTGTWEKLRSDELQGWGQDITLGYQLVNFRDKLLIAKAMGYEKANYILKVFIPEQQGRSAETRRY